MSQKGKKLLPEVIELALVTLQQKEPILRTKITKEPEFWFRQMEEPKIDFKTEKAKDHNNWWIDELEKEIEIKFNTETGPLWRTIYYESSNDDDDTNILIFTFHHAILDGGSIMAFYEKFLSICAQIDSNKNKLINDFDFTPSEISKPMKELWKQPIGWFSGIKFICKMIYNHFTGNLLNIYSPKDWNSPGFENSEFPRHTRIFPLSLNENQLNELKLKCKAHNVTIHSAISAVALVSYVKYYNGNNFNFAC